MKYEKRNQYADIDSLMRDRLAYLEPAINCIKGAEKAIDLIKIAVSENIYTLSEITMLMGSAAQQLRIKD